MRRAVAAHSPTRGVRKPGAGSVARADRRLRRIKTMTTTSKSATAPPRLAATIKVVLPTTPHGIESLRAWGPIRGPAGVQACVRACKGGWCRRFLSGCQCALVGVCGLCTHSHLGIFPLCMSTLLSGYPLGGAGGQLQQERPMAAPGMR
jgi:hypothetical protein